MSFNLNPSTKPSSNSIVDNKPQKPSVIEFQMSGDVNHEHKPKLDITKGRHRVFVALASFALFLGNAPILAALVLKFTYKKDFDEKYAHLFLQTDPVDPLSPIQIAYITIALLIFFTTLILPSILPKFGRSGQGLLLYIAFLLSFSYCFLFGMWRQSKASYGNNGAGILILVFSCWLSASFGLFITALFSIRRIYKEIGFGVTFFFQVLFMLLLNFYAQLLSRQIWEYGMYILLAMCLSFYYSKDLELIVGKRGTDFHTGDWVLAFFHLHTDVTFRFWYYWLVKKPDGKEQKTELFEEPNVPIA